MLYIQYLLPTTQNIDIWFQDHGKQTDRTNIAVFCINVIQNCFIRANILKVKLKE